MMGVVNTFSKVSGRCGAWEHAQGHGLVVDLAALG